MGETGEYVNGLAFKKTAWKEEGRPIVRIQNLTDPSKPFNYTDLEADDRNLVSRGEILVSWSATLDAFLWRGPEAVVNQHIFKVIPDPKVVDRGFLYFQLKLVIEEMTRSEHLHGSTMKHINRRPFLAHEFLLPPLPEQRLIVEAIDTQFSLLDSATQSLEQAKRNVERARASILKAAVEGRLVPTEAALARKEGREYEHASGLLQRILAERKARHEEDQKDAKRKKKYKEPVKPDTDGLPEPPEGWVWATVDQLADGSNYGLGIGPFGSNLKVSDYRDEGVPLVFVRHVRAAQFSNLDDKFVSGAKAKSLAAHSVMGGDILVTKMGDPPGDAALYPRGRPQAIITADVIKWTAPSFMDSRFLVFATRSPLCQQQIQGITKGVAQKKVSLGRFAKIAYPLPPLAEQHRIVDEIDRRFSILDAVEAAIDLNLRRCERLRQAILKWAFEGKLVQPEPTDVEPEPAEVAR